MRFRNHVLLLSGPLDLRLEKLTFHKRNNANFIKTNITLKSRKLVSLLGKKALNSFSGKPIIVNSLSMQGRILREKMTQV